MADLEFIAPPKVATISFSLEPAYNTVASLQLICEDLSGFSGWVHQTVSDLSPEKQLVNSLVCGSVPIFLEGKEWLSFEAWLDHLETLDPVEMRDREVALFLEKVEKHRSDKDPLPSAEELLADRELFLSIVESIMTHKGKGKVFNREEYELDFQLLNDPPVRKDTLLSHLREMWNLYLEEDWKRNLPMLQESVAAFETLDFSEKSTTEAVLQIIDRDHLPDGWDQKLGEVERIIFIPSAHIGPFILLIDLTEKTARMVFGARVPKGATIASPALQRSELLMRLNTLADETRLHILELLTAEDELGAKDIMSRLDLSQSAASRHLRQLSVTGYLIEGRRDGSKYYRLNQDRVKDTTEAIEAFLK
jgi:DNA-binding transcriptional ArsR family regulator